MKLVDNWKKAHTWISMHCMIWAAAIQGAWEAIPPSIQQVIPQYLITTITISLLVLGVAGRLIKQSK